MNPTDPGTFLRLISGGADFAECLPRAAGADAIGPGRIVGVKAGHISLATEGADALLVTTDRAVVVGNAPAGRDVPVETVALVGQVALCVSGPVRSGDFILPSGRNDGEGRAVAAAALSPALAGQIVGRAWQDKPYPATAPVVVAVGIQGADAIAALSAIWQAQDDRLAELQRQFAAILGQTAPER